MERKMYWDRGCNSWVGPMTQEEIDAIEAQPGNISVGEIRDYNPDEANIQQPSEGV